VAYQEVIKEFGANSAHPLENPTPFSNFFQLVQIFAIPFALTYTLGRMTGSQHGWAVWAAMALLFLAGVTTAHWAESRGNPQLAGITETRNAMQSGGNMEGKEVRFDPWLASGYRIGWAFRMF
jgi:K+-transporting ATPase ATPase A chain